MKNPNFVKLAESMHIHALCVREKSELAAKMKEFLEYDNTKPVLMEVFVEPNEHVFPMVSIYVIIYVFLCWTTTIGSGRQGFTPTNTASVTHCHQ